MSVSRGVEETDRKKGGGKVAKWKLNKEKSKMIERGKRERNEGCTDWRKENRLTVKGGIGKTNKKRRKICNEKIKQRKKMA